MTQELDQRGNKKEREEVNNGGLKKSFSLCLKDIRGWGIFIFRTKGIEKFREGLERI